MMMVQEVESSFAQTAKVQLSLSQQSGICHWVMMEIDPQNQSLVDEAGRMWQEGSCRNVTDMTWREGMMRTHSLVCDIGRVRLD